MYLLKTKPVQILITHRHDSNKEHSARPDTNTTTTKTKQKPQTKQTKTPCLENRLLCQKLYQKNCSLLNSMENINTT